MANHIIEQTAKPPKDLKTLESDLRANGLTNSADTVAWAAARIAELESRLSPAPVDVRAVAVEIDERAIGAAKKVLFEKGIVDAFSVRAALEAAAPLILRKELAPASKARTICGHCGKWRSSPCGEDCKWDIDVKWDGHDFVKTRRRPSSSSASEGNANG
jgi:hypothetical protein